MVRVSRLPRYFSLQVGVRRISKGHFGSLYSVRYVLINYGWPPLVEICCWCCLTLNSIWKADELFWMSRRTDICSSSTVEWTGVGDQNWCGGCYWLLGVKNKSTLSTNCFSCGLWTDGNEHMFLRFLVKDVFFKTFLSVSYTCEVDVPTINTICSIFLILTWFKKKNFKHLSHEAEYFIKQSTIYILLY